MQIKRVKKKILKTLGILFIVPIINILCKTLRYEECNEEIVNKLLRDQSNVIFAFWHGTMLVPWFILKKYKPSTIISQSSDGDILTKILNNWGYSVFRGSSSQGGKEVLEKLNREINNNRSIAITPDGPRGPEKVMKAGTVVLAKKTSAPIILIGIGYRNKFLLNSWDKFEIPYFFSKVKLVYSEPIFIDSKLSYEETDFNIKNLSERLNQLQNKALLNC